MNGSQAYAEIMKVVQQLVADHVSYPLKVDKDNRCTVDQAKQVDPYLEVEIKFMPDPDGGQIDIGSNPIIEQWGQIWLTAACKEGAGSLEAMKLLDFVVPYFDGKCLGTGTDRVHCRAVTLGAAKKINGLWKSPAIVNFYYHRRRM